ncbi:MAG: protein kinase [Candidatus Krumholzibacteria bacterium]|nr:protein kinase [Candidatus Krumholzibacteria bacterium]
MIGQTISHYKILDKLGEGGMGVVYKAEDLNLKRLVALKFLPARTGDDPLRFLQEARAVANLNHPNICSVHSVEEVDEHQFIDMELVDGVTLRDAVPIESIDEVLSYAAQIASALNEAHSKQIVHRDVKAENIMIDAKRRIKVMDFGVAKLKGELRMTHTSATIGTVGYMAPEQIHGGEADPRSDIFSFGILLFEMLTGKRPFRGEHESAMMYSILHEDPLPVDTYREHVPVKIQQIIGKTLEKEPARRYQSFSDVLDDLQAVSADGVDVKPKHENSIVVLPFENMSSDKENEYFSDGLTEEIITDLSRVQSMRVISRTSAMKFKSTDKDVVTISRELNVHYVLEGSVRKSGNAVRITAQLIDALTDGHIWAEKYSGTLEDIFDIQENVSRAIVDALKVNLSPEEDERIARREIPNVHAYECYLKARRHILLYTADGLEHAYKLLRNGLKLVGDNVLLYAGISYVYWQFVKAGIRSDKEYLDIAERYAEKIFAIDPESHHGYRLMGLINAVRGNPSATVRNLKRALAVDPNDPDTVGWLGLLYGFYGKGEAGLPLTKRLQKIDPLTPTTQFNMAFHYWFEGQFQSAAEAARRGYEMHEGQHPAFGFFYGYLLACQDRFEEAYPVLDFVAQEASEDFFRSISSFLKHALQKNRGRALQSVTNELNRTAKNDLQYSAHMAECYSLIGEKDKAIKWLTNAVNKGFINHPFLASIDPFFKNLRGGERFNRLMQDVKRKWETFET